MDLVGRKAWILPGRGLFVPMPCLVHTADAFGASLPQLRPRGLKCCEAVRERTAVILSEAKDLRIVRKLYSLRPNAGILRFTQDDRFSFSSHGLRQVGKSRKHVNTVGTNSASLLESAKPQKNELKTNSKRTQKEAEIFPVMPQIQPDGADSFGVSLLHLPPHGLKCCQAVKERTSVILSEAKDLRIFWRLDNLQPNAGILRFAQDDRFSFSSHGLSQLGKSQKDVKIVGTNSTSLLESAKLRKNELKTNSIWSEKSCIDDANPVKLTRKLHHRAHRERRGQIHSVSSVHSVVNLTEQSQNVIENKGTLQKSRKPLLGTVRRPEGWSRLTTEAVWLMAES